MGEFFVYCTFAGFLLTFFPVFLWVDAYGDVRLDRLWFSVSAYRHLKLIGGYAELDREGIAVHITKKTALFIPFDQMGAMRKKFEITKGFQLWRFRQTVETGGSESIYGILLAAAIQSLSAGTFAYLRTKHPFLSLKNSTLLAEEPCLKLAFETALVFNGFVIAMALSKKILEVIINWIRRKKSTASWKRQRSS